MKNIKIERFIKFFLIIFLLPLLFSECSSSKKVSGLGSDEIENMVNSSQFVFVANRVTPLRGSSRYLTSSYDVTVKKDTLVCYLPFFGRATQAPMDLSQGGIQFRSVNFTYEVNSKNGKQWDVVIKPNDNSDVQQMYFNIFPNGNANLNVVSSHKDPISFSGHIEKVKQ